MKWTSKKPQRLASKRHQPGRHRSRPALELLETRLVPANLDVLTYHYDNFLSGNNAQETTLTPANVNAVNFGKLFSHQVDGQIYATPLYKANLAIPSQGTHNVAIVVTEHDGVFAFDADSDQGANAAPLWQRSFINPAAGITSVPSGDTSGNVFPEYGITGTPVIDAATNTMYFVTNTKEVRGGTPHYVTQLRAIDITTGHDRATASVVTIGDSVNDNTHDTLLSVPGTGAGSQGGILKFNSFRQLQRPALTLTHGVVYVGYAGYNDQGPYHGWVVGYRASDLALQGFITFSPNARAAGIWQSGGGLGADAAGNLFFATGNTFSGPQPGFDPAHGNYGESVVKLTPSGGTLQVSDYFTPFNWPSLDGGDLDLGSGGTMLLPDAVGSTAHPHLMVETGKTGRLYLIDRENLGHNNSPNGPDRVVQILELGGPGIWGNPSFVQTDATSGLIYYHGSQSVMRAVRISAGVLSYDPNATTTKTNQVFGYPGGQPVISSNGLATPIAWDLQVDSGQTILHAYNALNLAQELYRSDVSDRRDQGGASVKFTVPTVTNGHVLVGSAGTFAVYGLFPTHTTAPGTITNLAGTGLNDTQIRLTWNNPTQNDGTGIEIERSTNPTSGFARIALVGRNDSSFTDTGLAPVTQYYYRVRAVNQVGPGGYSNTASAATHIATPILASTNVCSFEIDLSWTRTGNDHYKLERSFNGGAFATIADNIPASQNGYVDSAVSQRGNYAYRVTAYNVNPNDSATSNVITVTNAPVTVNHTPGFASSPDLTFNGNAHIDGSYARLTTNLGEVGTVFTNQRFNVTTFNTSFEFRIHDGTNPPADGFTFIIQGNSATAIGFAGGALGYGGVGNSVAIKFDFYDNEGEGTNSTGIFTNGRNPTVRAPGLPPDVPDNSYTLDGSGIDLKNANVKHVDLAYDGTTLTETLIDTVTNVRYVRSYTVNIQSFVGSDTAYVGFGGGTGGLTAIQDIQSWTFNPGQVIPGAPTNALAASVGANDATLVWRCNSVNEDGFKIERSDNGASNFHEIGRSTSPTFHDVNLPPGNYYYRVRAFNARGDSGYSNVTNVVIGPISPFTDHSAGFTSHADLQANNGASFVGPRLRVTDGDMSEARTTWTTTRVGVFSFSTSFLYQVQNGTGSADGLTFAIQNNDPGQVGASGGCLGYCNITRSVAVMFDLYSNNTHHSTTKVLLNGSGDRTGAIDMGPAGIVLGSNHPLRVDIAYDGTQLALTEVVTDTVTGAVFRQVYTNLNIPQIVQGTTAFVGFTGGTGGETSTQDILSWSGRFLDPVQPINHFTAAAAATTVAGTTFPLTVTARDGYNNVKADYRGIVHFTATDRQAGLPNDYTFTATDNGVHTFMVTLKTAAQTVTATDTVTGYITGGAAVTVTPAAASLFIVTGFPANVVAGTPGTFTVTAQDPYGNTATGYTGTVTFSSTDLQAMLPASTTLTNGTGTFPATLKTAGTQSITVRDGTLTGSQGSIIVTPAAATQFLVAGFASPTTAGDAHTFVVTAKDPYGNTDPTYRGTVHFSSSDPQATLEDDHTFTAADNGVYVSGAILYTAGTQSLLATDTGGSILGSQDNIQVQAAAATSLLVSGYPTVIRPDVPTIITVTAMDPYGNVAPTYLGTVTFSSTDPAAYLPLDYTFTTADNGVHRFAALLRTPGFQTITATDTADDTIIGVQDVLVALPATHFLMEAPDGAMAGVPFQVTVFAVADDGNFDPLYAGTVHFSSTDSQAMLPDDYTFTLADGGAVTFTVTFNTTGAQILLVQDTIDSTFNASATIQVNTSGAPGIPGGRQGDWWLAAPVTAPPRSVVAETSTVDQTPAPRGENETAAGVSRAQADRLTHPQRDANSLELIDLVLGEWAHRLAEGVAVDELI